MKKKYLNFLEIEYLIENVFNTENILCLQLQTQRQRRQYIRYTLLSQQILSWKKQSQLHGKLDYNSQHQSQQIWRRTLSCLQFSLLQKINYREACRTIQGVNTHILKANNKFYQERYISMSKPKVSQTKGNSEVDKFNYHSVDYLEPRFPRLVNEQGLNILRSICSVLLFIIWILVFVWIHPIAQIVFMTMWGNSAALITSILSLYISLKGTENVSSKIKKWNYLLLEFVFSMEMVITIVYWIALHDWIVAMLKAEGNEHTIPLQVAIHSVPLFAVCCNVILSKVRFNPGNWKITFITSTVFMFVNYGGKQIVGKPLYPFLPWDGSFRTYFNAVFLVLMATVLNYLCSKFIENFTLYQKLLANTQQQLTITDYIQIATFLLNFIEINEFNSPKCIQLKKFCNKNISVIYQSELLKFIVNKLPLRPVKLVKESLLGSKQD